ncbi:MAG: PorT family protein [bacterium]|nr:PorT family protein [bacterium]
MKKSVVLLFTFAAIALLAFATPASAAGGGLKAGLTMSTFTGSDAELVGVDPDYRMGFAFGGYLNHALSPTLSFQPEAYYAMKGAKYEDGGESLTFKFAYLQIPLLLKMQPEGSNFFFYGGPDVGINLSAKVEAEADGISAEEDLDEIKSLDFGLTFGAGVAMEKFSLEARYTIGLSSFDDTSDPDTIKNSGLMLLIGMGL